MEKTLMSVAALDAPAAVSTDSPQDRRLQALLLVRAAQSQASKSYGIVLATALVVMAQWQAPGAVWLPWFVGLRLLLLAGNGWINRRICALADAGDPARVLAWEWRFVVGHALSGACWGMVGWMLPSLDEARWAVRDIFSCLLLIYLSSIVLITTAHAPRALAAHVTAMWLVAIGTAFTQRGPLEQGLLIAVAAMCLLATSLMFGRVLVRQTRSGVRAELERERLTERLRRANEELGRTLRQAVQAASRDPLTGVLNRRALYARAEYIAAARRRQPTPCAVLLLDLDHFKQINDRHGHAAGDEVLVAVAGTLTGELREVDVVARWGGEEFLVLLPDCGLDAAQARAERLRRQVAALEIDGLHRRGVGISASIGVAAWPAGDTLDATIRRADGALYRAKSAGRDCISIAA